ncbi:response regulator transcription factor [Kibdelosporangium phytohabitans]|uniref:response regulator transcription factor n=1 Tax=Kibdelosporangium phytohabitans TaxID=860235 RepID=UPI00146FCC64|nr:LuxR C-terminal-related transcriptional regulator [Kibdelosporangium phytohabitans]MBE1461655.1 DNA-binding CsgD family transcriptional regulator [Kibdelosporangium phytohabitans]
MLAARDGARTGLVSAGVVDAVAEPADTATAARLVAAFRPQVPLLGDHRALGVITELRERHPDVRVPVLSHASAAGVLPGLRDHVSRADAPDIRRLTARERDVLRCLAKAYDNHEIAAEPGIAVRTVNRHLEAIGGKLGTRRRSHLVRLARTAHAS